MPDSKQAQMTGALHATIRSRIVCPHCWHRFAAHDVLYISEHPELVGDPRLGPEYPRRFLPSRFTADCAAIDAKGFPCYRLACPRCHLELPRPVVEYAPRVVSIIGAPACGKSYFITSLTWRLRNILAEQFALAFGDADPLCNNRLNEYESLQFLNPDDDALVELPKTETFGDHYHSVIFDGQAIQYIKPFLFTLKPAAGHPNARGESALGRLFCLYDNAGESFLPGQEHALQPVTGHLAASDLLMFLFDPTQDVRFRKHMRSRGGRLELDHTPIKDRESGLRQETVLREAAQRVARSLRHTAKSARPPLIMVVTKFDAWAGLLGGPSLPPPWRYVDKAGMAAVETALVEEVSGRVRRLLGQLTPEIIGTAEDLSERVLYIPVSATGGPPEFDEERNMWGFRPGKINPIWAEVPLLYYLARWERGIVAQTRKKKPASDAQPAPPPNR